MYFDQQITKPEVKHDPLSLEGLIAWLEKQPENKTYCYDEICGCLAAQYNNSIGRIYTGCSLTIKRPGNFDQKLEQIAVSRPHTFRAALKRARNALVSPSL